MKDRRIVYLIIVGICMALDLLITTPIALTFPEVSEANSIIALFYPFYGYSFLITFYIIIFMTVMTTFFLGDMVLIRSFRMFNNIQNKKNIFDDVSKWVDFIIFIVFVTPYMLATINNIEIINRMMEYYSLLYT